LMVLWVSPPLIANVYSFLQVFLNLSSIMVKLRVPVLCFTDNSNASTPTSENWQFCCMLKSILA
jgi:hypothetical protein